MLIPTPINELITALSYQGPENPSVHENILKMFSNEDPNLSPDEQIAHSHARFKIARKLYQGITFNTDTPAIFYRLEDKNFAIGQHEEARRSIRDKFKKYIKNGIPSKDYLNSFLTNLGKELHDKAGENKVELEVLNYMQNALHNIDLPMTSRKEIDKWFERQVNPIKKLASEKFYDLPDIFEAYRVGRIYNPVDATGLDMHNWGVNAAWAIGVARQKLPINIQAELNIRSGERTKPEKKGNPSAFALEIAIAVKTGYGLHIANQGVKLNPPEVLNIPRTSGIPGDGILPTKEEQLRIYRQCVLAQGLYTKFLMEVIRAAVVGNAQINFSASTSTTSAVAASNSIDSKEREEKITSDNVNVLMQSKGLSDFVYDTCINGNESMKSELIGALELLRRGNSLEPILNTLQQREHKAIWSVLGSNSFGSTAYDNLKKIVASYLPENQKLPFLGVSAAASSASATSAATVSNHLGQHQESVAFPASSDNLSSQAGAQIPAKSFLPSYMQSTKSSRIREVERKRQQEEAARANATEQAKKTPKKK